MSMNFYARQSFMELFRHLPPRAAFPVEDHGGIRFTRTALQLATLYQDQLFRRTAGTRHGLSKRLADTALRHLW